MKRFSIKTRHGLALILVLLLTACASTTNSSTTSAASGENPTSTLSGASTTTTHAPSTTDSQNSILSTEVVEEVRTGLQQWGVSEDSIQCVTDGLVEGGYVQGLEELSILETVLFDETAPLTEAPPEFAHFMDGFLHFLTDPQDGCLRPSELASAMENMSIEGQDLGYSSYGDDPVLDRLHDGCLAGSLADCDMLYLAADFGSEYEAVATSCGGLVEELESTSTCMGALQNFSEAEDLASQCQDGFFLACDAYYLITVVGSEEEELAATCGGVRESNLTTPCWLAYGFGSR